MEENIILDTIDKEIRKYNKRKIEYLEVDRSELAKKYENMEWIYENIYSLVIDGFKYRKLKEDK